MLGVALSVDGKTERELSLKADLDETTKRANVAEAKSAESLQTVEETAKAVKTAAEEVETRQAKIAELEASLNAAQKMAATRHRTLKVTLDQVIEAIAVEYLVTKPRDGMGVCRIAGGKVTLNPIYDGQLLLGVHLMAGIDELQQLTRTFALVLRKIEPSQLQDQVFRAWFFDSLVFAAKHQAANVYRIVGDYKVHIHVLEITKENALIVVAISAAED